MPVDIGSRIGAYEVLALLGQGGMGRVYRARDTRLKRDVAIKALQPEIVADADRIARFRREAETLAAVNHPHIASIHDVLDWEGSQLLVLELVEGETLAERIQRGAIPIREALVMAQQIARALEAAHSAGIVHRDLKPANVKITPEGVVKVLDFGLAKGQARDTPHAASLTHSPTNIASATAGGVILGTASYMSPEQARGQIVDTQSDVWSFGCVLFEMLTGRRAFEGPTVTDVLAAVVRGEADWSRLPRDTPVALRALLGRCLQKERARRLHHIADARIEIDDVLSDRSTPVEQPTTAGQTRRPWAWSAAGILLVVAAGLALALALALRPAPPAPEMRVEIMTPPSPDPVFVAMSPDGQTLAFVAATDGLARLWLRSLKEGVARPLAGTELATSPFWAPDSRSLGFFADGKLKRIDLDGGVVRVLASAPIGDGGTWNQDGVIVYAPSAVSPIFRVSAAGGEDPVAVTRLATGQTGHRYPHFLPDHRHFFFYARGTPGLRGIYIASLDSAESRHVLDADSTGLLASTGDLLFVRQRTLFAQRFRADRLEVAGTPFAITNQIAFDGGNNAAAITTSPAGPLAYRTGGASGERHLTWFDRSGKKLGVIGVADTTSIFNVELSPDGQSVALNRTVDEYQDVWLVEATRGVFRRFTFDPLSDQIPVWSPDGQRVVFSSNRRQGAYDLYMKAANGPDTEVRLLESAENKFPMSFSADGRFLLYRNTGANTNWDLWALPLSPDGKPGTPFPVVQSSFQELMGELSPDGRWVVYQSNESGKYEVYVQSFPQAGARTQVSTNGGSQPRWRRDGKELFYVGLDSRLMAAPVTTGAGGPFQAGTAAGLFATRLPGGPVPTPQKHQYAVSANGQRFLMNNLTDEASTQPITLILNWSSPAR